MPLPEFRHCLICEEVRQEKRRLLSLLGVYGIAPDVEILVRDFAKPVGRLAFVLFGNQGGDRFKAVFRILSENREPIVTSPEVEHAAQESRHYNIAVAIEGLTLPGPGKYTFELLLHGRTSFTTQFQARQGREDDFD